MDWFHRNPVGILGLVAALVQLLSATCMDWSTVQQGMINATAVALAGFISAGSVSRDAAFASLAGLVKAVIALALAFNLGLSPDLQSALMIAVTAIGAFFVRTQVTASVQES